MHCHFQLPCHFCPEVEALPSIFAYQNAIYLSRSTGNATSFVVYSVFPDLKGISPPLHCYQFLFYAIWMTPHTVLCNRDNKISATWISHILQLFDITSSFNIQRILFKPHPLQWQNLTLFLALWAHIPLLHLGEGFPHICSKLVYLQFHSLHSPTSWQLLLALPWVSAFFLLATI